MWTDNLKKNLTYILKKNLEKSYRSIVPRVVDLAQKILIRFIKFCQYVEFCYYMYLPHPPSPTPQFEMNTVFRVCKQNFPSAKKDLSQVWLILNFFCMLTLSFKGPSIYISLYANFGLSWLNNFGKSCIFIISPCKKAWSFTESWIPLSKYIWCQVWLKMAQWFC